MIDFMPLKIKNEISPTNTCGDWSSTIQGCIGCDGACLYSCDAMCANICLEENSDGGGSGGGNSCKSSCSGTCVTVASVIGSK